VEEATAEAAAGCELEATASVQRCVAYSLMDISAYIVGTASASFGREMSISGSGAQRRRAVGRTAWAGDDDAATCAAPRGACAGATKADAGANTATRTANLATIFRYSPSGLGIASSEAASRGTRSPSVMTSAVRGGCDVRDRHRPRGHGERRGNVEANTRAGTACGI
jgi:hypothetical protein